MKMSKRFSSETSTSHLPSKMAHTSAFIIAYDEPMAVPDGHPTKFLTLVLTAGENKIVKVRMTADEALKLSEALSKGATNHYGYISVPTN